MTSTTLDRSAIMRAVKSCDTKPELIVRRITHSLGFRYRLHRKNLPGKPDLVFPSRSKVIFVHGCFWHQHTCPRGARSPKTNRDYWLPKLQKNKERDARNQKRLREMGWQVITIWECELADRDVLGKRIRAFLE
ncbi:MAG: DNA mismatch endonuclease Vsr [Gammaproteobacteria bacterium]|nr:DNA mismatch endonuclease Vsr [Gammaproteobacteria bacterium]MYF59904.1 DNA mismatch endonuclease Vsr [Gammaproteobacteria bacterium]